MLVPVHLQAPEHRLTVRGLQVGTIEQHRQILLGVAAEVFDHPLGLRVSGLAEIRPEAVVGREADVVRVGHDHVRHRPRSEAAHPVTEDHRRHPHQLLEALGQQAQRRLPLLVECEAHETPAAPGQHRAEDVQAPALGPVDDQVLARHRLPGPVAAPPPAPLCLGACHRPAQVARRAHITRRPRQRQHPLGRDDALRSPHLLGHQFPDHVGVAQSQRPRPVLVVAAQPARQCPLHGLIAGAAKPGGRPVGTELLIGIDDVQLLPRRFQCRCSGAALGVV